MRLRKERKEDDYEDERMEIGTIREKRGKERNEGGRFAEEKEFKENKEERREMDKWREEGKEDDEEGMEEGQYLGSRSRIISMPNNV